MLFIFRMSVERSQKSLSPVFLTIAINSAAYGASIPATLSFGLDSLHLSSSVLGLAIAAMHVSHMCGMLIGGRLSDAYGRKPFLVYGCMWYAVPLLLSLWLCVTFETTKYDASKLFILTQFVGGLTCGVHIISQSVVMDIASFSQRGVYLSQLGAIFGLLAGIGSLLGGALMYAGLPTVEVFPICAVLHVLAGMYAYVMLDESLPEVKRRPLTWASFTGDEWTGFSVGVASLSLSKFFIACTVHGLMAIYPFFLREAFGSAMRLSLAIFTGIASISQTMALGFGYPICTRLLGRHFTLIFFSAFVAVLAMYLPITRAIWSLLNQGIWKGIYHGAFAIADGAIPDIVPMYISDRHVGAAQGLIGVCGSIAAIVSSIATGALYHGGSDFTAPFNFLAVCGIFATLSGLFTKYLAKTERDMLGAEKKMDTPGKFGESARL